MKRLDNPTHRFEQVALDWEVPPPEVHIEVYEDATKSILAENNSPDIGFRWSLNPYRGCTHACAYCYARPSHEYLGFGAGTDFDTRIAVKLKAPELLREALAKRSWRRELIAFSGDTDCYQPLEAQYLLTRRCLEVCLEFGNPVGLITKSFLVTRDVDILEAMAREGLVSVAISVAFADDDMARLMEPGAPRPSKRIEALARLAAAGVPCEVVVAPIIPGLNDDQIPAILERARAAGAVGAGHVLLRLPGAVREVFLTRLKEKFPLRAKRVEALLAEARDGRLNDPRFGHRMTGSGPYWEAVAASFELHCRRLGLTAERCVLEPKPRPVPLRGQMNLFDPPAAKATAGSRRMR